MPVLRTRNPTGGAWRGANLRSRNTGTLVSTYLPPGPLWNDLFAGYRMEEALGADRVDVLGARDLNDAVNDVQQTAAVINNGALLTTLGSELARVTTDFAFPGDWTAAFWMKNITGYSAFSDEWMASWGPAGVDWVLFSGSSELLVRAIDTDGVSTSSINLTSFAPSNNTWYFISFTYDSTTKVLRASVDGANFTDGSALPNGMRTQGTQLRLRNVAPNAIPWAVDELYFFTAKKSDEWMARMYKDGAGRTFPG